LTYNFIQELAERYPFYIIRLVGGILFLTGMVLMAINVYKTVRSERNVAGANNLTAEA